MEEKIYSVYVAGAISPHGKGNLFIESLNNVRRGIKWSIKVWKLGFIPYCPFFDFLFWLVSDEMLDCSEEMIKAYSIEHEKRCNVVFVIPNEEGYTRWEDSAGVAGELDTANMNDIPVVFSIEELLTWKIDHKELQND